jgi:hypothetical protein
MMTFTSVPSLPSDHPVPFTDQLRLAVAAYLARFRGASRYHLPFEALLTTARESSKPCDFALVAMLGLLGLRIFEATGPNIADLGVLVLLPRGVGRVIDRAVGALARGPILLNSRGARESAQPSTLTDLRSNALHCPGDL